MTRTERQTAQPVSGPVPGSIATAVGRLVRECRCGGLYLNPDAHRDAFGHRPEPVTENPFGNPPEPVSGNAFGSQALPPADEAPGRQSERIAA
jgi:hypothetical protein